jgi:DNA invertase Pin-like site-specific DNA recombinase
MGKMILTVMAAVAELESGLVSERTKASWAILSGRRHRIRTQLRRYGTDIAQWRFHLSRLM